MREQLLGYLLEALDPQETELVRRRVETDAQWQQELARLRGELTPLACDRDWLSPPQGLARRTCHLVASHAASTLTPAWSGGGWRLHDLAVAACILVTSALLFFPAANRSRTNAQLASCQNNLRQMGLALLQYSQQRQGSFPALPTSGKLAAAGLYAPLLREHGYLDDDSLVLCPAAPLYQEASFRVPSLAELKSASGQKLTDLKARMGGNYGYNLGFLDRGRYQPVRNMSRPNFALMADAPVNEPGERQSFNHGGYGQNVLFEDGHVEFVSGCRRCDHDDDFFANEDGQMAAGKHQDDAVIGPSDVAPLAPAAEE